MFRASAPNLCRAERHRFKPWPRTNENLPCTVSDTRLVASQFRPVKVILENLLNILRFELPVHESTRSNENHQIGSKHFLSIKLLLLVKDFQMSVKCYEQRNSELNSE